MARRGSRDPWMGSPVRRASRRTSQIPVPVRSRGLDAIPCHGRSLTGCIRCPPESRYGLAGPPSAHFGGVPCSVIHGCGPPPLLSPSGSSGCGRSPPLVPHPSPKDGRHLDPADSSRSCFSGSGRPRRVTEHDLVVLDEPVVREVRPDRFITWNRFCRRCGVYVQEGKDPSTASARWRDCDRMLIFKVLSS